MYPPVCGELYIVLGKQESHRSENTTYPVSFLMNKAPENVSVGDLSVNSKHVLLSKKVITCRIAAFCGSDKIN